MNNRLLSISLTGFMVVCIVPILLGQELASNHLVPSLYPYQQGEEQQSLASVLNRLGKHHQVNFFFESNTGERTIGNIPISTTEKLEQSLQKILVPLNLTYEKVGDIYMIQPVKNVPVIPKLLREDPKSPEDERGSTPLNFPSRLAETRSIRQQIIQKSITGQVTDLTNNEGLPGVNILAKGTSTGTVTDIDGNYRLTVSDDVTTLVFSSVGYETKEVEINGRTTINMSLSPDVQSLSEVVVVGYGTQEKKDLTSAISTISSEEVARMPVANWDNALQGISPGVEIQNNQGRPGANSTIRIRGVGSIGNTDPLVVVDGVPVGSDAVIPTDVESIQVLKDAAAAAIYGSRGANGVVLITTKSGQTGAPKVTIDSYVGFEEPWRQLDLLNSQQWAELVSENNTNAGGVVPERAQQILNNDPAYDGRNTNWQDGLFQQGLIQQHNLSVSGGSDVGNYYISAGFFDQQGILIKTPYKRYNVRVNSEWGKGKFTFGENIAFRYENNRNEASGGGRSLIEATLKETGPVPIYDETNLGGFGGPDAIDGHDANNPVGLAHRINDQNFNRLFTGAVWGQYEFIEGLTYKLNFGFNSADNSSERLVLETDLGPKSLTQTELRQQHRWNTGLILENTLNFQRQFGKHNIGVLAGITSERYNSRFFRAQGVGLQSEELSVLDLVEEQFQIAGDDAENRLYSLLGRVTYSYNDRYLLTANVRRDGSSRFGQDFRYGVFPSVSVGWRISEEPFLESWRSLDNLKLRASYGTLGNQNIGDYRYSDYIAIGANYNWNGERYIGAVPRRFGNPDIKWETVEQLDIGIDLDLFNGAFSLTADYYNKETQDMLVDVPIPASSGSLREVTLNSGSVRNRGFEFMATYRKNAGDFQFDVSANLATIDNEVLSLATEGTNITQGRVEFGSATRTEAGHPIGSFYGLVTDGIFQTQAELDAYTNSEGDPIQPRAEPGDIRFVDLDGDGNIDADDRDFIGSPIPDLLYGFTFNAAWKGLDASIFFQGSQGNDVYAELVAWTEGMHNNFNASTVALNRWTPENTNTDIPRAIRNDPNGNITQVSDRYVKDGSYLRLKNVVLGYTLPQTLIEPIGLSNVRFYLTGRNLLTFTDYPFYDPEIGSGAIGTQGTENTSRGIDNGYYPQARTYIVGLQVSF